MEGSHILEIRSIKDLVDSGIRHVPAIYIRSPHERPLWSVVNDHLQVPVISFSNFSSREAHIVQQIQHACSEWGVFQVINHGVPTIMHKQLWAAASHFFALPTDEKMHVVSKDPSSPLKFFTGFPNEKVREWKDTLGFKPNTTSNMTLIPSFLRDPLLNFHNQVGSFAHTIGEGVASSLGLARKLFHTQFHRQTMAINYYPPCPQPELTFGLSSHSDFGSITILMQDVVGLQVKKGDQWINVKPIPNAFVILIGDQLEILTNGHYRSVEHRALTNNKIPRMSVACFYGPDENDTVAPIDKFVSDTKPYIYKATRFSDYLKNGFGRELNGKSNLELCRQHPLNSR